MPRAAVITLKKHAEHVGYCAKTLRTRAIEGYYPPHVMKKDKGEWVVDTEEWDRWYRSKQ
ncbi:hypothetical protein [Vibrio algivorus]|uniref:AlpA family phage regulatory protein n=1 Tax=Vibrio algivorus TaxID=1667024 RepID=A0A557P9P7_9VIBR|nr:hypothetical protein [Vibrio algivorus]TVO37385.1 hypothetical protein FOF44_07190 [Vibrio algivorus]GLT13859.1 hypothetical protein GCM10007931_08330 [Vibrio algivorus]